MEGFGNIAPLAERVRPENFDEFIGQIHLVGIDKPLRKMIEAGTVPSMIFWGPPGVGKTTLAGIIANTVKRPFYALSAVHSGVKEVREVIEKAQNNGLFGNGNAIVFIDEIHRFNKSQQDSLLNAVEKGIITLIGATTENPSFEVNGALLSRCQVYVLYHLEKNDLLSLIELSIKNDEFIKTKKILVKEADALIRFSGGDGRKLLNLFEIIVLSENAKEIEITNEKIEQIIQTKSAQYDKSGEWHYDIISAFIKSIRGSDPNSAVYWLARMLSGGEDPKFIARRMLILASEDIGNANPTALVIANNCFQAVAVIGMPEGRIILSQCAVYLASSVKSNASYTAIEKAMKTVNETGNLPVPLHLRNARTKLMLQFEYGKDYAYDHSYERNFAAQEFLPEQISNTVFYNPGNNARENEVRKYLRSLWQDKYSY